MALATAEKTTAPVIAHLRGDAARGVLRAIMAIETVAKIAAARAARVSA